VRAARIDHARRTQFGLAVGDFLLATFINTPIQARELASPVFVA
jgi:hypothetical protein